MTDITVPVRVLLALGGLDETDPPVLVRDVDGTFPSHPGNKHRFHNTPAPSAHVNTHLVLPASAPALRRVLARWLGMKLEPGEVPRWRYWKGKGWCLGGPGHAVVLAGYDNITDPMEALVAVLTHEQHERRQANAN